MPMSLDDGYHEIELLAKRLGILPGAILTLIRTYEGDTWCFVEALMDLVGHHDLLMTGDELNTDEEGAPF